MRGLSDLSLLPALARALREQLPGVDFAFQGEMLTPDQVAALRNGSIDPALMRPPGDATENDDPMVGDAGTQAGDTLSCKRRRFCARGL